MADNKTLDNGTLTDIPVATDEVTYSGDTADVQLVRPVLTTGTEGAKTVVELTGDATNGLDVDVTRLPALVAGTANIGDVDVLTLPALPAGTNNIGDVDVLTLPALPAGTNNIGDVDVLSSALPTGAATEAKQDTQITALQLIDDPVQVLGTDTYTEATSKGMTLGAVRRDADTSLVNTTNEFAPLQVDALGRLKVEAFSGETLPVSGTVTTSPSGDHTVVGKAADGAATSGNPVLIAGQDGTNVQSLKTDTSGELQVDVLTLPALVAGTANIGDVDVLTLPNVTLAAGTNTNEVVGDIAHDTGVGGNPLLIAGASQDMDDTAPPNRVNAESDTTRIAVDRDGVQFAHPHGPQLWSYHDDDVAAVTTDGTVHAAPGVGLSLYVTDIIFSIGAATASSIFLEESTTKVLGPFYLDAVAGRGMHIRLQTPKKITANTALLVTNTGSISFSVDILGYTGQG